MKRFSSCLFLLIVLPLHIALADVRLPNVFGQHMVLQRRKPIPV